ncbi:hypothetical protein AB0J80_19350 [Actinoplanes sp. NPDC049548]|uniref:hypothetical protein n=1 Tax=Actinoplanes sp. NPDC049548 TaxID=3155152 RepID=UPI003442D68B
MRGDALTARPVTAAVAGVVVSGCAFVAGSVAAVPGWLFGAGGRLQLEWNYLWVFWPLVLGLAVAGAMLAARPRWGRPAAVVSALLAAQICGHGIVAVRDWFNTAGASGGMRQSQLALVVGFAAVVAVCAAVATCVSTAVLWREPVSGWRSLRPKRPGYVVAGLVVVVGLPIALALGFGYTAVTMVGQFALTYSLPWGAGLAAAGWLGRRERVAVVATVGLTAVLVAAEFAV